MTDHRGTLQYTRDDDGIWYECSCGYMRNLGYWPSVAEVVQAEAEHRDGK